MWQLVPVVGNMYWFLYWYYFTDEDEEEHVPEIDPYDLMEPVDILSKLPKDFYEKVSFFFYMR